MEPIGAGSSLFYKGECLKIGKKIVFFFFFFFFFFFLCFLV